jgi:hypothetical protein
MTHVLSIGIAYDHSLILKKVDSIKLLNHKHVRDIILSLIVIVGILFMSIYVSFQASKRLFKPLKQLNSAMREVISENLKTDLTIIEHNVSIEINIL